MNKLPVISFILVPALIIASCSDVKRDRGREYMPDMAYSRAYETSSPHDELREKGINYTGLPVPGTIKRGELYPFALPRDEGTDSTNYVLSKQVKNPITELDAAQLKETERLYLINCGICHGTALDGNGPLYNSGNGPYPAAPRNLVGDPKVVAMPEGQLFYSVTYGKGLMGPYGPQLSTTQRWRIVHFVKMKQLEANGGGGAASGAKTGAMAASDSTQNAAKQGPGRSISPSTGTTKGQIPDSTKGIRKKSS